MQFFSLKKSKKLQVSIHSETLQLDKFLDAACHSICFFLKTPVSWSIQIMMREGERSQYQEIPIHWSFLFGPVN